MYNFSRYQTLSFFALILKQLEFLYNMFYIREKHSE
ncbi:hypothetical protein pb186bvf_012745 [Paramecium bursaria]